LILEVVNHFKSLLKEKKYKKNIYFKAIKK